MQATLAAEGVTVDPTQPVHPTFLYESIWCLVGFVILALLIKHRRFNGQLFLSYVIWYGIGRFWIEGLRTDSLMVTGTLRTSQLVALVSVVVAVVLMVMGLLRSSGKPLMVPLAVSNVKASGSSIGVIPDSLPASASHAEFVKATAEMNKKLAESRQEKPEDKAEETKTASPEPETTETESAAEPSAAGQTDEATADSQTKEQEANDAGKAD